MADGAQVSGRVDVKVSVLLHEPCKLATGVGGVDAVWLVDEQVKFGEALILPFCDALSPLGEPSSDACPSYPPKRTRTNGAVTRMCKRPCAPPCR